MSWVGVGGSRSIGDIIIITSAVIVVVRTISGVGNMTVTAFRSTPRTGAAGIEPRFPTWVFITGGCSGRGVQWMGAVLYNRLVYNIIKNHYTLFPLHPPLLNLDNPRLPQRPGGGTRERRR